MNRLLLAFMLALFFFSSTNGVKNNSPRVKAKNKDNSSVIKSKKLPKNRNGAITYKKQNGLNKIK